MGRRREIAQLGPMTNWSRQKRVDYISQLPDALLCRILSFMSTRGAFMTSVLSKRWTTLWTMVPVLDFSDVPSYTSVQVPYSKEQKCLKNFVDKVLSSNNISSIECLHFVAYGGFDPVYLKSLNNAIKGREIREIHLIEPRTQRRRPKLVERPILPPTLFCREKLVVLKIKGPFLIDVQTSLNLPSVEVIDIDDVKFVGGDVMEFLLSGCPVLREFTIVGFRGLSKLIIRSLTLKKLKIMCMWRSSNNEGTCIVVEAPTVWYLDLTTMGQCDFSDLSTLVEAKLEIFDQGEQPFQLVRKIPSIQKLELAQSTVEWFGRFSESELPMLLNLTHLKMAMGHDMLQVLKRAPNLVHLIVDLDWSLDERRAFSLSLQTVPSCLLSLPTSEIQCFRGFRYSIELVGYLFQNARVLKEMKIDMPKLSMKRERDALKELLVLPRASPNCKVIICSSCENSE